MRRRELVALGLIALACGSSSPSRDDAGTSLAPCAASPVRQGEATYYDADGSGNCSFAPIPGDFMVAALNTKDYDGAAACGACAQVAGPGGTAVVRIVDRCPGCDDGDIDLSQTAFGVIAELSAGRVQVTWSFVPCEISGDLSIHYKDGSNAFWTAVQIRNHRHGVASVSARGKDGQFSAMERANYNYFIEASGLGDGPHEFELVDAHGQSVSVGGVSPGDDVTRETDQQFPGCDQRP